LPRRELPPLEVVESGSLPEGQIVTDKELALLNQFLPDLIIRVLALANTDED
jgi:hypothetical protein